MTNPFQEGIQAFIPLYLRILMGISLWFISYAIFTFIGLWIASTATGISVMGFNIDSLDAKNGAFATGLKIIQVFSDIGLFVIPALVLPFIIFQKGPVSFMGMRMRTPLIVFLIAICMALCIQPLVSVSALLNEHLVLPHFLRGLEEQMQNLEKKNEALMDAFLKMRGPFDFSINTLIIAVLPAIAEELFFRGFLQKTLQIRIKNGTTAVIVTAFIFSFIHLEFYGFLPRFILGLLLGYAYLWSGDIKVPILIHFTNNFLDLCLSYFTLSAGKMPASQNSFDIMQVVLCVLSLFVLALLMYVFKMKTHINTAIKYEGDQNEG